MAEKKRDRSAELTPREKRFIEEYIKEQNATKAAVGAGYSEKSAHVTGSRLLKKAKVLEEVRRIQQEQLDAASATAVEITEFLTAVMRGETTDEIIVKRQAGEPDVIEVRAAIKDRIRAAELLGRRLNIFDETVKIAPANSAIRREVAEFLASKGQTGPDAEAVGGG